MLNRRTVLAAFTTLALPAILPAFPALQDQEETKLAQAMGDINRSLRKLKKASESKESLSAAVAECCRLQHVVLDAKSEVPYLHNALEGEQKTAGAAAYRKAMQALVNQFFNAENAALAGDKKAFEAALSEMNTLKKQGHNEHKPQW